jgi:hypothetical protein
MFLAQAGFFKAQAGVPPAQNCLHVLQSMKLEYKGQKSKIIIFSF